jgi:hypothetical protein
MGIEVILTLATRRPFLKRPGLIDSPVIGPIRRFVRRGRKAPSISLGFEWFTSINREGEGCIPLNFIWIRFDMRLIFSENCTGR